MDALITMVITGAIIGVIARFFMPVSYTHLDVYKRQVLRGGSENR